MKLRNLFSLFAVTALAVGLSSCNDDESVFEPANLGSSENDIIVSAAAGTYDLEIHTNYSYHVDLVNDADWLTLSAGEVENNIAVIGIKYDANSGFARKASFVVLSDADETLCDTISFRQRANADPILRIDETDLVTLDGEGGVAEIPVVTNIPIEELEITIEYADEGVEEWITNLDIIDNDGSENRTLTVTYSRNDADSPRSVTLGFSFTDGWGINYSPNNISLLQANRDGGLFTILSFEELRSTYATGKPITEYVAIDGVVVSNKEQGNAGCPVQTDVKAIDFTPTTKTIYFESEDAQYGIAIMCDEEEDNVFDQFDRVTLMLQGATLTKRDSCVTRYELTGFSQSMVFNREAGKGAPEKTRTIATLSDDDIYTYVRLTDVQLPVRGGSLYCCDAGFCSECNVGYWTKLPTLVIDKEGNDIYLLTNDKCLYKRDGRRLPYGMGSIGGVVVHEHFTRYGNFASGYTDLYSDIEAEGISESLGYIGDYQLRHQTEDDVWGDMGDDFEKGSFKMLTEYRYRVIADTDESTSKFGTKIDVPSYGTNGWRTHTYQEYFTGSSSKDYTSDNTHLSTGTSSYWYLGPGGNKAAGLYGKNSGNKNGLGIVIDTDKENMTYDNTRFGVNGSGKYEFADPTATNKFCGYGDGGWTNNDNNTSSIGDAYKYVPNRNDGNEGSATTNASSYLECGNGHWWDYDTGRPYAFLINFSTEEISSATVVCMQIAMRGGSQSGYTPRYWCAEWSLTESQAAEDDEQWSSLGEFTLTNGENWSYPNNFALSSYKTVNFKLPTSVLGQKNVYVRIRPTSDKCPGYAYSDSDGDYDNKTIGTKTENVSFIYFAVRYL